MTIPPFYITTPIYYVNDVPHLGHAYTTIAADALARFHRMHGDDTWFLTGTDEHGQKIDQAAAKRGVSPKQLADEVVVRFQETWKRLDVANDDFIRTTDQRHKDVVTEMWKRIEGAGDIYEGSYAGWYCIPCEVFYPETQLEDGKGDEKCCPIHKSPVTWVEEPSYFFAMSKYQERLLQHIADHPDFIQPENYRNEVVAFVKSGLRDLSVSRTTFKWGIPVPGHPEHVIYVWIDALTNYISALGLPGSERYERFWPATCHLIGKDILRFHAVYWPCMLMSAGLPLPKTIFAHGWWTVRGEKISKSLPATRVDPVQLADDVGADALRYFLLREVPLGNDGDFSYEALLGRFNAELANDLGNLINRCLTLTGKSADGKVPEPQAQPAGDAHEQLAACARKVAVEARAAYESYAPSRALESIWALVREANTYVNTTQPWKLAKQPDAAAELAYVLRAALEAIAWVARMVWPVMPEKATAILAQVGAGDAAPTWPEPDSWSRDLPAGAAVARPDPLFPRIDADGAKTLLAKWIPADATTDAEAKPQAEAKPAGPTITFDEFKKLELRVAQVLSAEPVPKTKKLLRLQVDVGEEQPRQVVAGIAEAYEPAALVGKKVILVANLAPATIRGVESRGMILAAGDKQILGLSGLDNDVPAGTIVR